MVFVAIVAAGVFFGPYFVRGAVGAGGRALGYDVSYASLANAGGRLTMLRPVVRSARGEPVFSAASLTLDYSLRDLFGGPYLYGVRAIALERPKLTLIHHRDGSYNVVLPAQNGSAGPAAFALPRLRLSLRDGSVGILDETRIFAHSRRFALEGLVVSADLAPQARSTFALGFALHEDGGTFPFSGRGTLDDRRGYELSRITGRGVAIAPLLDYALNSTTLHFANGVLNDIDARFYGLPDRSGTMQRHVSITANLDHFQPYLNALAKPLRDGRGAVRVYDQGVTFPRIDGSIAGIPVRIAGALYGLSKPSVRLGITGRGDVGRLLTLNSAGKALPIRGPLDFKLLVEGDATQPTTVATFISPGLSYGAIALQRPSALVALHGPEADLLRSAVSFDGIDAEARGSVLLEKHTTVDLLARVSLPAARLPYGANVLGAMRVSGTAVSSGVDAGLLTTGELTGRTGDRSLAATFAVDGHGVGSVGPLVLTGPGRQALYARVVLDRPNVGGGAAIVSASHFAFSTRGPQPALPGIVLPQLPAVDGTLDGDVAGAFAGKRFAAAGRVHVTRAHVLAYPVDDLTARFAATSPLRVALDARFRGSLAALARAAGGSVAATGSADVPIAVVATGPNAALAQIHGARFANASVGGVPLEDLEATLGLRGRAVDVYAARIELGGNDVVAQGSFGNGGSLAVSASNVELAALRGFGLPVRAGTLSAVATIGGTASAPELGAGVAASGVTSSDPRFAGLPIDANARLGYSGDTLVLADGQIRAGNAMVAALDGHLDGLRAGPRDAVYVFDARVRHADVGTLARVAHAPLAYPEGTLNALVHVSGRGAAPRFRGTLALPEGSVNGLRFRDATVALSGSAGDIQARNGRVRVGSSVLAFSADAAGSRQSASIRAPAVDLSDFNDYFDRGDTLGGTGSIAFAAVNSPDSLATSGRVRLAHTRFRRFDVGDSSADWHTSGRTISAQAAVGGSHGRATLTANLTEPATAPLRDTLRRSFIDAQTTLSGLDLGTWLPVAGVSAPVEGTVDANAVARGSYPNLTMRAHAALTGGQVRRIAIRTASLDVTAAGGRATIANAVLAIDNLTAHAAGSLGLRPADPVALTVSAQTADVGALAKTLTGATYDAAGTVATTVAVGGTLQHPTFGDTLDADRIRYGRYTLPHAHSDVALTATRITLRQAEVDLGSGRLLAHGYAPVELAPIPGIGPAGSPLALDLTLERVDLAQFADLLPKGTTVAGALNGEVALTGTQANPALTGGLSLSGGTFSGPQEKARITSGVAHVTFAQRTLNLTDASANIGGGTLSAKGFVSVADLEDPARTIGGSLSLTSENATFDLPQFFRGRVLGAVTLSRTSGAPALLAGNVAFSSTRIPTTALLPSGTPETQSSAAPLPVNFDIGVDVDNDVRVQSGPVDIGAKGTLHVGGTLAKPTATGVLTSTGGTISFYRSFSIQYPSRVTFEADNGVIPYVDATATTTVSNPQTDVTLHVTGEATHLNVDLESDPNYSREQILGLLVGVQALGAVSGVANANGGAQQNPFQALASGELGNLLTQNILEPFSSQLGGAVGLENLAINYNPGGGGLGIGAQKKIFKNVNAVFAQSFNYPQRESIGLIASPNDATALQLSFFSQPESNRFDTFQGAYNLQSTNQSLTSVQPATGSNGFALSIQRKFK